MTWIFAQVLDASTKEGMSNRLMNLVENLARNPIAITMLFAFSVVIVTCVIKYRYDIRRAEIDATLKQEMIGRGMSAEEIERVLAAKSDANDRPTLPHPGSSDK